MPSVPPPCEAIRRECERIKNAHKKGTRNNRPSRAANTHGGGRTTSTEGADASGYILGTRDTDGRRILSQSRTLPTSAAFIEDHHTHADGPTLRSYAGTFMAWDGNRYSEREAAAVDAALLPYLHESVMPKWDQSAGAWTLAPFPANPRTVSAARDSIAATVYLPATTAAPAWLDSRTGPPPAEIVATRSTLLHLPTMRRIAPTPLFFNVNALDFDYDENAPEPREWFALLTSVLADDAQAWELLQEWFGYCLTGDTKQQKTLLICGPRRGGKGTILRVLSRLVGTENVCGPTVSSLAEQFGLQPLIGKSLAGVSDARFSGDNVQTVVERILCITGEDAISINRKLLPSVTMKLPTRFVFLTNELPRLPDSSNALVGRLLVLRLTESFYGRENLALTDQLAAELPGILRWAIAGWKRLHERGRFVQPESGLESILSLEDLGSPVGAFVREHCELGATYRVPVAELYLAFRASAEAGGQRHIPSAPVFGKDLQAAVPGLRDPRRNHTTGRFYEGIRLRVP